jgi:hypothetical protein
MIYFQRGQEVTPVPQNIKNIISISQDCFPQTDQGLKLVFVAH